MKNLSGTNEALLLTFYSKGHRKIHQALEKLEHVLQNFQYEGKAAWSKNKKQLGEALHVFNTDMLEHLKTEELVIYPYFKKHVPKYEPVIDMLLAGHQEVKTKLRSLNYLFVQSTKTVDSYEFQEWLYQIDERGLYFVYLLRHHLRTESDSVFRIVSDSLTEDETVELSEMIGKEYKMALKAS